MTSGARAPRVGVAEATSTSWEASCTPTSTPTSRHCTSPSTTCSTPGTTPAARRPAVEPQGQRTLLPDHGSGHLRADLHRVASESPMTCPVTTVSETGSATGSTPPPRGPPAMSSIRELLSTATSTRDPILTIDEPAARASARTHSSPSVRAGRHMDGVEATRCSLWRREAWLLADCWQVSIQTSQHHRPGRLAKSTPTCTALLSGASAGSN